MLAPPSVGGVTGIGARTPACASPSPLHLSPPWQKAGNGTTRGGGGDRVAGGRGCVKLGVTPVPVGASLRGWQGCPLWVFSQESEGGGVHYGCGGLQRPDGQVLQRNLSHPATIPAFIHLGSSTGPAGRTGPLKQRRRTRRRTETFWGTRF
ncbi:unnamed protein product [Pleuronectes platessa]|uniref:Uncharacterized protein n=1 Tax=Pleuronectes platessa TaxID=8262 RepID=A0A9N7YPJ2_PLEPL|nr:unnamed protein product [Pleuronectes platessa]